MSREPLSAVIRRDGHHRIVAKGNLPTAARFVYQRLDHDRGWVDVEDVTVEPGRTYRLPEEIEPLETGGEKRPRSDRRYA